MYKSVIDFFEETILEKPLKSAIIDNNVKVTFQELELKSKILANEIIKISNESNLPIAIFLKKSKELIYANLAVVYSGNIFMNIDVKSPIPRIKNIIKSIEPCLIITNDEYIQEVSCLIKEEKIINISKIDLESTTVNQDNIHDRISNVIDTDPFVIINTSGSTGIPKGVVLNHRSFINFTNWSIDTFEFDGNEVIGSLSPAFFDIFIYEMCLMLFKGATIVILDNNQTIHPIKTLEELKNNNVSFIFWVPSIMVNISNLDLLSQIDIKMLKLVWFAGEVFPTKHFNYWQNKLSNTLFVNLYGPIEITLDCTYYIINKNFKDDEPLPIGYACANTGILILNEENNCCQDGEIGELCVKGTCLAWGYYNNPEKTAEVFIQNPLNNHYPELIYKTGDMVCVNDKKEIVFKGRKDSLIKHMGYRIELSEIEHILINELKLIDYGCVLYNDNKKEITLFYEEKNNIDRNEIKKRLKEIVPIYMVPTRFYKEDNLPRNSNGKIDRLLLKERLYIK